MADLFPALNIAGNLAPTTKPELAEFDQRMMPLLAAFPLYELQNKHSLRDYHGLELGICLLLFVLEKMLHYEPCTYEDAQGFVRFLFPALTKQQLTYTEAASLTQKLLDELSNQGRPFVYPYRSPVDGMDHEVKFGCWSSTRYRNKTPSALDSPPRGWTCCLNRGKFIGTCSFP